MTKINLDGHSKIREWRADPILFVREVFKVEPDAWQKDFLMAFCKRNRVAAKACKGPGKTAVLSWCAWWFLVVFPHPKIAATSITGDNLKDGLWTEMAKWQKKSQFLTQSYVWTATRIYAKHHPETWWMSARAWAKGASAEQQANALAGLHADFILFIIDEAGGVPDAVMAAAEAALANAGTEVNPNSVAKLLICGNPTHLSGPLYRACTSERNLWHVIEITGDPDDPKRSPRISIQWAKEQIAKYGADNPWVLVNVFGKFPPSSINALLGPDEVSAAMRRTVRPEMYNRSAKALGVDVARQGDDRSIIFPRQGIVAFKPKILRVPHLRTVAGHVAQAIQKFNPDGVNVDATGGFGWGVIEPLQEWGYTVNPTEFSNSAFSRQFFNKRTEMLWEMAQWVKKGGCLPNIPELAVELTALTYTFKGDQIFVISKDQIKDEIGVSPDLADGLALTFAVPLVPKNPLDQYRKPQQNTGNPLLDEYGGGPQNNPVDDYNVFN